MASVFLHHVVGDLTVGKPDLVEFIETETVEAAIRAIGESTECGIPVWRKRSQVNMFETSEMRQQRFVGILSPLDIVVFLAKDASTENQEKALNTPVSEFIFPDNSLLKSVDPATRGRLTVQTERSPYRYTGMVHALRTVLREEGPRALYKGWLPSVIGVVTYIVRGSGRVQVVGVDGKRVLETTVKAGNLFIVPRIQFSLIWPEGHRYGRHYL